MFFRQRHNVVLTIGSTGLRFEVHKTFRAAGPDTHTNGKRLRTDTLPYLHVLMEQLIEQKKSGKK